jgi:RNA polymerase sigma-70 factor, ECF subfamily
MTGVPKPATAKDPSQVPSPGHELFLDRLKELQPLVDDRFAAAGAAQYGFAVTDFTGILAEVLAKYLAASSSDSEIRAFILTLRADELVLARGCAVGNEAAWDAFLIRYRERLYEAGIAIAKDYNAGRELADSLYSELCGAGSHATSPLFSYMGYGSLEGWLRTIMARSFIDRYRSEHRLVSLEEQSEEAGMQLTAPEAAPIPVVDQRLEAAVDEALAGLDAEDSFILASFFLHDRTLAEVAAVLKLHESTVSRRIQKITVNLRKQIVKSLMRRGMTRRQADEALEIDVRDLQTNVRGRLQEKMQDSSPGPSPTQNTGNSGADE